MIDTSNFLRFGPLEPSFVDWISSSIFYENNFTQNLHLLLKCIFSSILDPLHLTRWGTPSTRLRQASALWSQFGRLTTASMKGIFEHNLRLGFTKTWKIPHNEQSLKSTYELKSNLISVTSLPNQELRKSSSSKVTCSYLMPTWSIF